MYWEQKFFSGFFWMIYRYLVICRFIKMVNNNWIQFVFNFFSEAEHVRDLVTTLKLPLHINTVEWKLKSFYDACMHVDNINGERALTLTKYISELGEFWYNFFINLLFSKISSYFWANPNVFLNLCSKSEQSQSYVSSILLDQSSLNFFSRRTRANFFCFE